MTGNRNPESEVRKDRTSVSSSSEETSRLLTLKSMSLSLIVLILAVIATRYLMLGGSLAGPDSSTLPSPWAYMFLIIFAALSAFLSKKFKYFSLTRAELCMIYMVSAFGLLVNHINQFIPLLAYFSYGQYWRLFLDPSKYKSFLDSLSSFGFINSETAVSGIIEGGVSVPWSEWFIPIVVWTTFFGAFVYVLSVIGYLLYQRWAEKERLTFGLTVPVLAVANIGERYVDQGYSYRNRIFLFGGILPVIYWCFVIANKFFPYYVPVIPNILDLSTVFLEPPLEYTLFWPGFILQWDLFAIGLGFIVPSDLTFSVWFLYLLQRALGPVYQAAGGEWWMLHTLIRNIGSGAAIGITTFQIWLLRRDIKRFVLAAFHNDSEERAFADARVMLFSTIVCLVYIVIVSKFIVGLAAWVILFYIVYMLCISIAWARVRAEVAMPATTSQLTEGGVFLIKHIDARKIGELNQVQAQVMTSHLWWRFHSTMGWAMDTFKIADTVNATDKKRIPIYLTVTFAVMMLLMFIILLPVIYDVGGMMLSFEPFAAYALTPWPESPSYIVPAYVFTLIGLAGSLGLSVLRTMYWWWPLSPVGLFVGAELEVVRVFAASFFTAWAIKTLVFRWGGVSVYKKLLPFFVGMMVFDVGLRGVSFIVDYIRWLVMIIL